MEVSFSQRSVFTIVVLALLFFFERTAHSEDARVLPKGRSRFSFTFAQSARIHDEFNGDGRVQGVVNKYSAELNAPTLSRVAPSLKQLIGLLNNNQTSAGDQLTAGHLDLDAEGRRQSYVFTQQYGLTDRLSVGAQVPVIRSQFSIRKGFSGYNNAESLKLYAPNEDAQKGLDDVKNVSIPMLENEIAKLGYAPITSSDKTGLGDVAVGGRFAHTQSEIFYGSVQLGVTLPTGATPPPNDLVALPFGEGAWDIGLAHIVNWSPFWWLSFGQGVHYTHKFENTQRKRVPTSEADILPGPDSERTIRRKLGDKAWTTASLQVRPFRAFAVELAYEWYWRFGDHYYETTGGEIDPLRSGLHYLETASLQLKYSTIGAFLRGQFPAPVDFLLTANHPVHGKNNPLIDYATAEVALYF